MVTKSLRLLLFTSLALLASVSAASAAPADLDPSFGSGGVVTLPVVQDQNRIPNAAQADGKVILGHERDSDNVGQLLRINPDGSVDTSFGSGGTYELPLAGGTRAYVATVIAQPNGRILVGGTATIAAVNRMVVWAVTPGGALDTTFNGGVGYRVLPLTGTNGNFTAGIGVQPDGDIAVIAGAEIGGVDGVVLQVVTSSGLPSVSQTKVLSDDMDATSVAIQPDGGVVFGAIADTSSGTVGVTQRFTEAGVWDAGFGNSGYMLFGIAIPVVSQITSVEARTDGALFPLGQLGFTSTLQTLLPSGLPNTGLDSFGITRFLGPNSVSVFFDGAFVGGGRLLATGLSTNLGPNSSPLIARFDASGALDPTFANGTITGITDRTSGISPVLQADGRYLIFYLVSDTGQLKVARLMGDYVAPPVAPLSVKFKTIKSTQTASKFRKFSGTASGAGLSKVQIAILKVDSKLLKKSKKCAFVKNSSGATKTFKAVKSKCTPTTFLNAKGTTGWSYSLKKSLPPGKYKLYARASGAGGATSSVISKSLTLKKK